MKSSLIHCDWLIPVASAPIADALVVVEEGRIAWLGERSRLPNRYSTQGAAIRKLEGVMLPGLVNAHTHLQYTLFRDVGAKQYDSFEHWCEAFEERFDAVVDPQSWADSAAQGATQSICTGTTVFSDIITHDEARGAFTYYGCAGIEYLEVIAALSEAWSKNERAAFIKRLGQPSKAITGVSPHAPYSLDGEVIRDLVQIAEQHNLRVHSHLAESSEEDSLYQHGGGGVLDIYGALSAEFALRRDGGVGMQAGQYAASIGLLNESSHVAHGVYLDRSQRALLKQAGTRVALCPRSNATIGLAQPPVAAYLEEGHDICVGTDSLASAPSLDLMADVALLYYIARTQGYTAPDLAKRLIEAATAGGARALGLHEEGYGTLVPGGPADLAVFSLSANKESLETTVVNSAAGNCVFTMVNGEVVHDVAT